MNHSQILLLNGRVVMTHGAREGARDSFTLAVHLLCLFVYLFIFLSSRFEVFPGEGTWRKRLNCCPDTETDFSVYLRIIEKLRKMQRV